MIQAFPTESDLAQTELDQLAETHLLGRLRAGESAAFTDLVQAASGRLLAVARRMLRGEEDARDAVQDAFLSAFRSLDSFDERSRLTTWLHRITVNACLMRLRSRRRHPERTIETMLPEFVADGHQRHPSKPWKPIDEPGIEIDELHALVRSKLDELPENYREVLILRDIEGLDTATTASYLGMTQPAVKTRLHRARQALKSLLDPYMTAESPA